VTQSFLVTHEGKVPLSGQPDRVRPHGPSKSSSFLGLEDGLFLTQYRRGRYVQVP
jgi:hypothetical protein